MALAYYKWGRWRGMRMLPGGARPAVAPVKDAVSAPAGPSPAPVASPSPDESLTGDPRRPFDSSEAPGESTETRP